MPDREPVAFISYVRSDDDHDSGRISELRLRLEGEVKMQTGRVFHIFQDRNDIKWGQQWKDRIEGTLNDVTFLIPIVTPSYFQSIACKSEFDSFLLREKNLGEDRLILPIYYVSCDEMGDHPPSSGEMAAVLKARNWADWRKLRFEPLTSPALRAEVASLATTIKETMKELEVILSASKAKLQVKLKAVDVTVLNESRSIAPSDQYNQNIPVIWRHKFLAKDLELAHRAPYYIYTTKYDEVIGAAELSQAADTMRYHSLLLDDVRNQIDLHESIVKGHTLDIASIGGRQSVSVSFLIDNSGSMRGEKIRGLVCWISIISRLLSQANIPNEVLGFTTRAWRGGQSRERWIADEKPANPGRLNDLRHIVYKSFEETFQEADTSFGIMLREGIFKENIDGEALLWAYSRIKTRSERRKILFVVSDGAPVDDSTLSANPDAFLHDHAVATIKWIKEATDVELCGIGIGHDTSRYYGPLSPTINEEHIGPDLLTIVALVLAEDWAAAGAIQRKRALPSPRKKRTYSRASASRPLEG